MVYRHSTRASTDTIKYTFTYKCNIIHVNHESVHIIDADINNNNAVYMGVSGDTITIHVH